MSVETTRIENSIEEKVGPVKSDDFPDIDLLEQNQILESGDLIEDNKSLDRKRKRSFSISRGIENKAYNASPFRKNSTANTTSADPVSQYLLFSVEV